MEKLSMCRICLTDDVRMHFLEKHLQDTFERLTAIPFETEDRKPLLACYICHARLQNCYKLRMSSLQGEKLLTQLLSMNMLVPQETLKVNKIEVASVLHLSIGPEVEKSEGCNLELKAEDCTETLFEVPLDDVKVKQEDSEEISDEDNLPLENLKVEPTEITIDIDIEDPEEHIEIEPDVQFSDCDDDDDDDNIPLDVMKNDFEDKRGPAYMNDYNDQHINHKETYSYQLKIDDQADPEIVNKLIMMNKPVMHHNIKGVINKTMNDLDTKIQNKEPHVIENNITIASKEIPIENGRSKNSAGETLKPFSCDTCQKRFISRAHLESHILVHTGEKPHQCEVCKKCFNLKSNLKRHLRLHSGEKPFKCHICKKYFNRKSNLDCHMRTHTGDKPCDCDVCQKYSNQNSLQVVHTRTHAREKPFQCSVCNKSFSKKGDLGRHARIHTGEKPYQCEVCNERFNRTSNLASHMRKHTGEKPYQCELCKKCFNLKSNLNRHVRLHTGTLFAMTIVKSNQKQSLV